MEDEMKKLNPEIREVEIGIRELRKIKVYPLSFRDQEKCSALISESLQKFMNLKDQSDIAFVSLVVDMISKNAKKILALVVDKEDLGGDILGETSNGQLLTIAETIYEVNYEALQKKVRGLFGTLTKVTDSLPGRPLQQFSDDTLDTDLNTSSDEATEKAVSP